MNMAMGDRNDMRSLDVVNQQSKPEVKSLPFGSLTLSVQAAV